MDYRLIPRSKKGLITNSTETTDQKRNKATSLAVESGAVELAESTLAGLAGSCPGRKYNSINGELMFTRTGSAIPCNNGMSLACTL